MKVINKFDCSFNSIALAKHIISCEIREILIFMAFDKFKKEFISKIDTLLADKNSKTKGFKYQESKSYKDYELIFGYDSILLQKMNEVKNQNINRVPDMTPDNAFVCYIKILYCDEKLLQIKCPLLILRKMTLNDFITKIYWLLKDKNKDKDDINLDYCISICKETDKEILNIVSH